MCNRTLHLVPVTYIRMIVGYREACLYVSAVVGRRVCLRYGDGRCRLRHMPLPGRMSLEPVWCIVGTAVYADCQCQCGKDSKKNISPAIVILFLHDKKDVDYMSNR